MPSEWCGLRQPQCPTPVEVGVREVVSLRLWDERSRRIGFPVLIVLPTSTARVNVVRSAPIRMSAFSTPRELAKNSEDDGTILPPPGSLTSHGTSCRRVRHGPAVGPPKWVRITGGGSTGDLAEDAWGLGRRRVPRLSARADQDAGVTLRVTGARHEGSPGRFAAGGSRFILPQATARVQVGRMHGLARRSQHRYARLVVQLWNLMNNAQ
jgi:hypothetical protein